MAAGFLLVQDRTAKTSKRSFKKPGAGSAIPASKATPPVNQPLREEAPVAFSNVVQTPTKPQVRTKPNTPEVKTVTKSEKTHEHDHEHSHKPKIKLNKKSQQVFNSLEKLIQSGRVTSEEYKLARKKGDGSIKTLLDRASDAKELNISIEDIADAFRNLEVELEKLSKESSKSKLKNLISHTACAICGKADCSVSPYTWFTEAGSF